MLQCVSGHPLLGFTRDNKKSLKVPTAVAEETLRGPTAWDPQSSGAGLHRNHTQYHVGDGYHLIRTAEHWRTSVSCSTYSRGWWWGGQ